MKLTRCKIRFWMFVTRHLPKQLIYFATLYLTAETTTGKYSDTIVPNLGIMRALRRFEKDNKIQ